VTPAGSDPTARGALYGLQTAFQRLYTRTRQDNLIAYAAEPQTGPVGNLLALVGMNEARAAGIIVDPDVVLDQLVADGAEAFINETFDGNGRTCASCHPPSNNFTIDVPFIASLPADDALFVAEHNPALATLENSARLHSDALITENVDGFNKPGVLRATPHTLAMATSIDAPACVDDGPLDQDCTLLGVFQFAEGQQAAFSDISTPLASGFPAVDPPPDYNENDPIQDILVTAFPAQRTGWGGDGAPLSGTLREFAIGAVVQHFPRSLNRVEGVDFRLPTDDELDGMEVFQLSLGRVEDVSLASMTFKNAAVENGKDVFMTNKSNDRPDGQAGKCETCHANAGANSTPDVFGDEVVVPLGFPRGFGGNFIFDTGVTDFTEAEGSAIPDDFEGPMDAGFGIRPLATANDCTTGAIQFLTPPGQFLPPFNVFHPFQYVIGDPIKPPGGFGSVVTPIVPFPGLCQLAFNTPPIVEAADTPPFFHDNSAATIEDAVRFYTTPAFNDEVGNTAFLAGTDVNQVVIDLSEQSVLDIAAFLRVLNAVENLRQSDELAKAALDATSSGVRNQLLAQAKLELADASGVLADRGLHPDARALIQSANARANAAQQMPFGGAGWKGQVVKASDAISRARELMVTED
jgi:cytochrome c peroxidase